MAVDLKEYVEAPGHGEDGGDVVCAVGPSKGCSKVRAYRIGQTLALVTLWITMVSCELFRTS